MTTSLARQLNKLAVPQTSSLGKEKRVNASLLFDRKEAESYERDTFYAIGLTGLEEIAILLPEFSKFHDTLYDESSKLLERSLLLKTDNEKLDVDIRNFLVLVSPFVLLKPALKALEWLVHRFRIHEFNADELLLCALPYHQTKIFARVLQIVDLNRVDKKWLWLKPSKEANSSLSGVSLFNHCAGNVDFLRYLCKHVKKATKEQSLHASGLLRTISLFYSTVVIGAIEHSSKVSENLLTSLLPIIISGLRSEAPDFVTSTYLVLSHLATKVLVVPGLFEPLLEIVLRNAARETAGESLKCFVVVVQAQRWKTIPPKLAVKLQTNPVRDQLGQLSHQHDVSMLTAAVICSLLDKGRSGGGDGTWVTSVKENLSDFHLDPVAVNKIVEHLLSLAVWLVKPSKSNKKDKTAGYCIELLDILEKRYPNPFDTALKRFMASCTEGDVLESLFSFRQSSRTSNPDNVLSSVDHIFLNHPDAYRRTIAVKQLMNADKLKHKTNDLNVQQAILARLDDEFPSVVVEVLKSPTLILNMSSDVTAALLNIILSEKNDKEWRQVKVMAIEALSSLTPVPSDVNKCVISALFPWMFSLNVDDLRMADVVLKSKFRKSIPVLQRFQPDWDTSNQDLKAYHLAMLEALSPQFCALSFENRSELLSYLLNSDVARQDQHQWFNRVVLPLVVSEILTSETLESNRLKLATVILTHIDTRLKSAIVVSKTNIKWSMSTHDFYEKECSSAIKNEEQLNRNLMTKIQNQEFGALLFCLGKLIDAIKLKSPTSSGEGGDLKELVQFSGNLFDQLMELATGVRPCRAALTFWFQTNFGSGQCFVSFLVETFSACIGGDARAQLRLVRCVSLLRDFLAVQSTCQRLPANVVPTLILVLQSQYKDVRTVSLQCLAAISKNASKVGDVYSILLRAILLRLNEIKDDQSFIHEVLSHHFNSLSKKELNAFTAILDVVTSSSVSDSVKAGILSCLADIQSKVFLAKLLPLLDSILSNSREGMSSALYSVVRSIVKMFCPSTAEIFSQEKSALATFQLALEFDCSPPEPNLPTVQMVSLGQVTKDLFKSLTNRAVQQSFLKILIDEMISIQSPIASKELSRILKRLLFDGKQVLTELLRANVACDDTAKSVKGVKLYRKQQTANKSSLETDKASVTEKIANGFTDGSVDNARVVVILEAIQHKKSIEEFQVLIPVVFGYLQRVLEISSDYETQLVLECLINFSNQLLNTKAEIGQAILGESQFHVESIVSCVRGTRNPRIHQHALQLLAVIAQLYPEHVLHNVMAIFTFMGSSTLRQDDSYSFDVITSTVKNVVPPIMENCRSKLGPDHARLTTINLCRIFVDALPDIAQHRRIPLFKCLYSALKGGPEELFQIYSLIMQRCVTSSGATQERSKEKINTDRKSIIDFALNFCDEFELDMKLNCCIELIKHLNQQDVLEEDNQGTSRASAGGQKGKETGKDPLFQLQSPAHVRHHRLVVIEFISSLLSCPAFLGQIVDSGPEEVLNFKSFCPNLLKETLNSVRINQGNDERDVASAKYWKVLHHRSLELLDKVIALLSDVDFVEIIQELLSDNNMSIRRKSLEMLSAKLQQNQKGTLTSSKANCFVTLLPPLLEIVSPSSFTQLSVMEEQLIERQIAFFALRHLCHLLAPTNADQLSDMVKTVINVVVGSTDEHEGVLSGALLCLAELCRGLKTQMIVYLPKFVPAILKIVGNVSNIFRQELLLLSAVTAIHRTVEVLPHFLSPYLPDILLKVCEMSTLCPENPKSPLLNRLASIRQNISKDVTPRVLYPAVQSCYRQFEIDEKEAPVKFLMDVLGASISHLTPTEAATWQEFFLPFFLEMFDYRLGNLHKEEEQIAVVEESIMVPILALAPKLSETTFRPFFIKFFDWATRPDAPFERCIVFYSVADKIADKLKSLFVLFAGLFIKHSATMLEQNNTINTDDLDFQSRDGQNRLLLLKKIVDCLHKCFLHDNEKFVNKERIDTLLQPLVNQIDNNFGSDADYSNFILNHLKLCLAQLAFASADEMHWIGVNRAVLLKTRSLSPKVRFAALQVVRDIANKMGEDYETVLPETSQFLAELLEDDSTEVENLCRAVIQDLETLRGSSMQDHFK